MMNVVPITARHAPAGWKVWLFPDLGTRTLRHRTLSTEPWPRVARTCPEMRLETAMWWSHCKVCDGESRARTPETHGTSYVTLLKKNGRYRSPFLSGSRREVQSLLLQETPSRT